MSQELNDMCEKVVEAMDKLGLDPSALEYISHLFPCRLGKDRKLKGPFPTDSYAHSHFTGDGDSLPIQRVPLTNAHYKQHGMSLNDQVWGVLPTFDALLSGGDLRDMFYREIFIKCYKEIDVGSSGVFDRILIAEVLPKWERGRLACNVSSLRTISSRLAADNYELVPAQTAQKPEEQRLWPALIRFNQRCATRRVDSLLEVVAGVQQLKVVGNDLYNQRKFGEAMVVYNYAAFELYPWVSSPLLFTSTVVFECGLAQLEANLWQNMAVTALKLAELHPSHKTGWISQAIDCADAVVYSRFVTHRILAKSFHRAYEARHKLTQEREANHASYPCSDEEAGMVYSAGFAQVMVSQFVAMSDPGDDSWAHRDCIDCHDGCTSLEKTQHKLNQMPPEGGSIKLPGRVSMRFTFDATGN